MIGLFIMINKEDNKLQQNFLYKYVFLKTDQETFNNLDINVQRILEQTENIHVYQIHHKPFSFSNTLYQSNLYLYSFNKNMDDFCFDNGYIPHFCFDGSNLFDTHRVNELHEILNLDDKIEVFWFPKEENITNDIEKFVETVNQLKLLNSPVCISFSSIFNNSFNTNNYIFLQKLLRSFQNPLYVKEKALLEQEIFSNDNLYIENLLQSFRINNIVLGLYGDEIVNNVENIVTISKNILSKNKKCLICENFEYCANRGIGYIQMQNNLTNCIGISLLQQN